MYQTIIRDSGGEGLIRVVSVPCGPGRAVVNGSLLIVPPGTVAYAAVNGMLSPPYGPGRHELFAGVDPFFVRLRHLMTRGDAGVTVSVFFLSTEKHCFLQLGTGSCRCASGASRSRSRPLPRAGCVSIDDPLRVLQRLVGSYSTGFSEEDLEPCLQQLMLAPVREALSQELSRFDVTQMNSQLQRLSERVSPPVRAAFADYGLRLERLQVMAVNIPDGETSGSMSSSRTTLPARAAPTSSSIRSSASGTATSTAARSRRCCAAVAAAPAARRCCR